MKKLWQKEYPSDQSEYCLNKEIEAYTVGNDFMFDKALVPYDCRASIAHAQMLQKIGILTKGELTQLTQCLHEIIKLNAEGKFQIKQEEEDCSTAIENYLVSRVGEAGKKIHTARSRNDQILTALRLYYKEELKEVALCIEKLLKTLRVFKKKNGTIPIPGFTHMRKAMPSSFELWTEAFIESMQDNLFLIEQTKKLIDQSPLGTAAGYGVPLKIDRVMTAKLLGFAKVQNNPMYVQHSRGKFEATIVHALSQVLFDLNKIASDIILWSMPEFNYCRLPDEVTTGSSIMPQKKNPDVLELMRAKYHTVVACSFEIQHITANLVSGYNRDLQLTKEPTMKAVTITKESLSIAKLLFEKLEINEEHCKKAMTTELYATQKAYELVKKGMAFRDAYREVGKEFMSRRD